MPEEMPYPPLEPELKLSFLDRFWFVFVIAALVCLIAIGVLLFLNRRMAVPVTVAPTLTPSPTPVEEIDETTRQLEEQGSSDEITEIEADLNTTDLTGIDEELSEIETELSY